MAAEGMSRPECFVTAMTGVGQSLNVNLHMLLCISSISHSDFPTVSIGVDPILSSDDILADLLINLLGVGDRRIIGIYYYGLSLRLVNFSGFSDLIFLFEYPSLSEKVVVYLNNVLLQCLIHLPLLIIIIASQSLQLQSLSHLQEPVQLLLVDLNLSLVDVVQDKLELLRGDSVKTEERMGVFVVSEDMFEVRTGG